MIISSALGHGRWGNNLFALAVVYATARRFNQPYLIPTWKYAHVFEGDFVQSDNLPDLPKYTESHFHYAPIPNMQDMDLVGYYQSHLYFEDFAEEIRQKLTFKLDIQEKLQEKWGHILSQNAAFAHVRRTDYLGLEHVYNILGTEYYDHAAMKHFPENQLFIIFSDDVAWCKENFKGKNVFFAEGSDIEDMCLMTMCPAGGIIANSSFSWWGAYLNPSPTKAIVAPKVWFNPNAGYNTVNLIPKTWHTI